MQHDHNSSITRRCVLLLSEGVEQEKKCVERRARKKNSIVLNVLPASVAGEQAALQLEQAVPAVSRDGVPPSCLQAAGNLQELWAKNCRCSLTGTCSCRSSQDIIMYHASLMKIYTPDGSTNSHWSPAAHLAFYQICATCCQNCANEWEKFKTSLCTFISLTQQK